MRLPLAAMPIAMLIALAGTKMVLNTMVVALALIDTEVTLGVIEMARALAKEKEMALEIAMMAREMEVSFSVWITVVSISLSQFSNHFNPQKNTQYLGRTVGMIN